MEYSEAEYDYLEVTKNNFMYFLKTNWIWSYKQVKYARV